MPVYREFKVFIRDELHLRKVQTEVERLGFEPRLNFYHPTKPNLVTTITTWADGTYDVWSISPDAFTFHVHQDTLTLEALQKMITAETGENDATAKTTFNLNAQKH